MSTNNTITKAPATEADRFARATLSAIIEPGETTLASSRHILDAEELLTMVTDRSSKEQDHYWQTLARRLAGFDLDRELAELCRIGGRIVIPGDPEWPTRLNDLGDAAPFALWVIGGALPSNDIPAVTITGARAATTYGTRIAAEFAEDLATQGVTIISGGAYGIDTAAHKGALSPSAPAARCPTVAVLAGGLRTMYPAGNSELFQAIMSSEGTLVTEVPPTFKPARWRFLERNRLLAALSDVTIIVEAGRRSGAVTTAHKADDLRREVGVVPGPITSATSAGCHKLIDEGAALITSTQDITRLLDHQA